MPTQKPYLSRACKEAMALKKPWAPCYGVSKADYASFTGVKTPENLKEPSQKTRESGLERLKQRLVTVPTVLNVEYVDDPGPHIFCKSHPSLKRKAFCGGILCHPLAALLYSIGALDFQTFKVWGTHAAVEDQVVDLFVPVRFRGRNPNHRNFDKMEKKRVKLCVPLWDTICGDPHCINPLHLKGLEVRLSLLGRVIGKPLENFYTGWADLRPVLENLQPVQEPPKFNKPRHVFEPRVTPQADLNMPTTKYQNLVKPLPKFYDKNGFDEDGFDREGYDAQGYDLAGCDRNGDAAPTPPELVPRVERRDTQDGFEIDLVVTTGKASLLAAYAKENGFTADFNANSFTLRSPNKDVANFNFILGGILQRGAFYPLVEVQP